MGRLTEDMTRLRDEIGALHNARETFTKDLEEGVSALRAGFRDAHAEVAETTKAGLQAFVSGLRESVAGLRQEFASANAGAHRAWFGGSQGECRSKKPKSTGQRRGR